MRAIITDNDAQYALDIVRKICTEVGPGLPGSPQERERAAILKRELESHLGTGNVAVEEFTFAPRAFLGSLPVSALFMLIGMLLNISVEHFAGVSLWLTAIIAMASSVISILLVTFEFIFGFEFIDPFFKKKQSINVIGTLRRSDTQNAKRLLILSGHHDSAPENTWLRLLGYGFLIGSAIWLLGYITLFVMTMFQLIGVMTGHADFIRLGTLGRGMFIFPIGLSIIFALFFNRGWRNGGNVPGAVDNLSGSALTVALCRFLVKNPADLPVDTEIRFISFGSEEAGVRGSRRYVERHREELQHLDVQVLNFEMVAYPEITILVSDVNGTLKYSPAIVSQVVAAAERAGVPFKVQSTFFGGPGTDAASFGQAGFKATTVLPFKMPQQMIAFYHQKWDTPENLSIEPLRNGLKLAFEWIRCGGE